MESSAKKLDSSVDFELGQYVWDKMTKVKYVICGSHPDGSVDIYSGSGGIMQNINKYTLTSIDPVPPKKWWHFNWQA